MGKSTRAEGLIYLVRHGKAEDNHPLGDEARGLTAEGRREFRELMQEIAGKLDLRGIATSPLVRAVQTAELMAEATGDRARCASEGVLAYDQGTVDGRAGAGAQAGAGLGAGRPQPDHG